MKPFEEAKTNLRNAKHPIDGEARQYKFKKKAQEWLDAKNNDISNLWPGDRDENQELSDRYDPNPRWSWEKKEAKHQEYIALLKDTLDHKRKLAKDPSQPKWAREAAKKAAVRLESRIR